MAEIRREQAGGTTQFLFKKTWQNDILDFFVDVQRKKNQSLLKLIDTQVNCSAGQIKRHAPDCSEEDFSTWAVSRLPTMVQDPVLTIHDLLVSSLQDHPEFKHGIFPVI